MNYNKVKHVDENDRQVSFWSTDDNVLCQDGKTLRENLNDINSQCNELDDKISNLDTTTSDTNGIPEGGSMGQVLAKSSNADYEVEWRNETTYTHPSSHPSNILTTYSIYIFFTF